MWPQGCPPKSSIWLFRRMGGLRRTCLDYSRQASLVESSSQLLPISSSCRCVSSVIYGSLNWTHRWLRNWLVSAGRGKGQELQEKVPTPPLCPFIASSLIPPWHFSHTQNPFLPAEEEWSLTITIRSSAPIYWGGPVKPKTRVTSKQAGALPLAECMLFSIPFWSSKPKKLRYKWRLLPGRKAAQYAICSPPKMYDVALGGENWPGFSFDKTVSFSSLPPTTQSFHICQNPKQGMQDWIFTAQAANRNLKTNRIARLKWLFLHSLNFYYEVLDAGVSRVALNDSLSKQFSGLCSQTSIDRELITYEVGGVRQFIWASLEAPKAQFQASLQVDVTNTLALLLLGRWPGK